MDMPSNKEMISGCSTKLALERVITGLIKPSLMHHQLAISKLF
jgi:hypothetical protein